MAFYFLRTYQVNLKVNGKVLTIYLVRAYNQNDLRHKIWRLFPHYDRDFDYHEVEWSDDETLLICKGIHPNSKIRVRHD